MFPCLVRNLYSDDDDTVEEGVSKEGMAVHGRGGEDSQAEGHGCQPASLGEREDWVVAHCAQVEVCRVNLHTYCTVLYCTPCVPVEAVCMIYLHT